MSFPFISYRFLYSMPIYQKLTQFLRSRAATMEELRFFLLVSEFKKRVSLVVNLYNLIIFTICALYFLYFCVNNFQIPFFSIIFLFQKDVLLSFGWWSKNWLFSECHLLLPLFFFHPCRSFVYLNLLQPCLSTRTILFECLTEYECKIYTLMSFKTLNELDFQICVNIQCRL